jgi:hypothetical protein
VKTETPSSRLASIRTRLGQASPLLGPLQVLIVACRWYLMARVQRLNRCRTLSPMRSGTGCSSIWMSIRRRPPYDRAAQGMQKVDRLETSRQVGMRTEGGEAYEIL